MTHKAGYTTIVSHHSGETEEAIITVIVIATGTGQIETWALSRSERLSKYNQLICIEEKLDNSTAYPGKKLEKIALMSFSPPEGAKGPHKQLGFIYIKVNSP